MRIHISTHMDKIKLGQNVEEVWSGPCENIVRHCENLLPWQKMLRKTELESSSKMTAFFTCNVQQEDGQRLACTETQAA